MKIDENGILREMKPEEIKSLEEMYQRLQTPDSLEKQIAVLKKENDVVREDMDEVILTLADVLGGAV